MRRTRITMDEITKLYTSILPIRKIIVTLRFIRASTPRFFHQIELTSMLRYWFQGNEIFKTHFRVDCPEAGQTNYQAGDYYRFTLFSLGDCSEPLQHLLNQLHALPASAPVTGNELKFGDNIKLYSLQDGFTEQPISHIEDICCYDQQTLDQEIAIWQQHNKVRLRWISPVRLLKDKDKRQGLKGEARFCRNSDDTSIELVMCRLHDRFAEFYRTSQETSTIKRSQPVLTHSFYKHLFWLDNHYHDQYGKAKVIGGMSGLIEFELTQETPEQSPWALLILGQFTGIGQSTPFGYGRYLLETPEDGVTHLRCLPSKSLLMRAAEIENIRQAYRHVLQNSAVKSENDYYSENEEPTLDQSATLQNTQKQLEQIQQKEYRVPELSGVILEKPGGGVRTLSIPPFTDRVLQRALGQIMTPALEQLFYQHSYGYRPGKSRLTAKDCIQRAWRNGYRWVYESDIEDFFDSVNLQRLRERLIALYDNDPAIGAIIDWMSAPVRYEGDLIQRKNGLPQGSPLSPLLANLMLDDFDSDMHDAGFMLIRYADDFVVLCKDQKQAQRASKVAQQSLAEHGFTLNEAKTQIKSMEQGFKYLGYLFVNDMALDIDRKGKKKSTATPHQSWLRNIAQKPATRIKQKQAGQLTSNAKNQNHHQIGEREGRGTLLYLTGNNTVISTSAKQVHVHRDDKLEYNLPWNSLQAILVFGNHHFTMPAMHAAMHAGVPVHFAANSGKYRGTLWNAQPAIYSYQLWISQNETFESSENALYASRQIVKARIIHMKEILRQRKIDTSHTSFDKTISKLHNCKALSELNGQEGNASREYFQLLQQVIPEQYGFKGRNRRPPTDPFNALLSLGYTVLYGYCESVIRASGLLPWIGFYHQPRGRHATLASDLMEPFRHIVERTALTMLSQQSLKLEDFYYTQAGACYLTNTARRKYFANLSQRFDTSIKARGQTESHKVIHHMYRQCVSLINWVIEAEPFHAWRIR